MNDDDERGFAAFVDEHGDALLRFARLLLLDRGEAEDALQAALLRLARHWPRGIDAPGPYVRMTLTNLARDAARRRHLVPVPVDDVVVGATEVGADDPDSATVARAELDRLLGTLPARQRVTVALRVIEGYDVAETAALMRCSPGTVKSNLARALASLRSTRAATTSRSSAHDVC